MRPNGSLVSTGAGRPVIAVGMWDYGLGLPGIDYEVNGMTIRLESSISLEPDS